MPLRFTSKLTYVIFDEKGYRKALDETLQRIVREGAREWLRAVIPLVPVYTGMARGSLAPLGRFLHVAVPINPDVAHLKKYGHKVRIEEGKAKQEFVFKREGGEWQFNWSTDVLHYLINEYENMSGKLPLRNPTPWRSVNAGNKAFKKYVEATLPNRLPKIADWIRTDTKKSR